MHVSASKVMGMLKYVRGAPSFDQLLGDIIVQAARMSGNCKRIGASWIREALGGGISGEEVNSVQDAWTDEACVRSFLRAGKVHGRGSEL